MVQTAVIQLRPAGILNFLFSCDIIGIDIKMLPAIAEGMYGGKGWDILKMIYLREMW